MKRLGLVTTLFVAAFACDSSDSSTPPDPPPDATAAPADPEPEPEDEPEDAPAPEPEPDDEEEVSEVNEAVFKKDGFEARDLECALSVPTKHAARYILSGLANKDEIIDACAPKGAAIRVEWSYMSGRAMNVSVAAENQKLAKCMVAAFSQVGAGVDAKCEAVILVGDLAAATADYEAR